MIKQERVFGSTTGVFIVYMAASLLILVAYRFIFPGEAIPLEYFSLRWRLVQGVLDFIALFPALVMASLVVPFGFHIDIEENFARFSLQFIQKITGTILAAIIASACYGLLFLIALPLVEKAQSDMRFKGELYKMAQEQAAAQAANGNWLEAFHYLAVCENIWPLSPPLDQLRARITMEEESARYSGNSPPPGVSEQRPAGGGSGSPAERQAVADAADAVNLAKTALGEERYYDAHWLATLASRLARQGSIEAQEAARTASLAWNAVSSQEPSARAAANYTLYHLKREGYEAMVSDDWIRAYYIFRELAEQSPQDPDVAKFLTMSEQGTAGVAFFVDELVSGIGETLTGAIFSIPLAPGGETGEAPGGRVVMRADSLITYRDYSYAIGLELTAFDGNNRPLYAVRARYAKCIPMTVREKPRLVILLRALDRNDKTNRWEPEWEGRGRSDLGEAQIALDTTYEHFLLLSKARRQVDSLFLTDLRTMGRSFSYYGYIPQVFQAEIIRRITEPVILLPLTILSIIIGWRFRAKTRPRYLGVPMLLLIPLVFHGLMYIIRSLSGTLGLWLLLSWGFPLAIAIFVLGALLMFILSLIILASQHGPTRGF